MIYSIIITFLKFIHVNHLCDQFPITHGILQLLIINLFNYNKLQ